MWAQRMRWSSVHPACLGLSFVLRLRRAWTCHTSGLKIVFHAALVSCCSWSVRVVVTMLTLTFGLYLLLPGFADVFGKLSLQALRSCASSVKSSKLSGGASIAMSPGVPSVICARTASLT